MLATAAPRPPLIVCPRCGHPLGERTPGGIVSRVRTKRYGFRTLYNPERIACEVPDCDGVWRADAP